MLAHRKQGTSSIGATQAKNDFGRLLEKVISGEKVVITKHDVPKAVMISVEQFEALSRPPLAGMDAIRAKYDAMLRDMQTPEQRAAMQKAFNATPEELGRAAVAAARKREQ